MIDYNPLQGKKYMAKKIYINGLHIMQKNQQKRRSVQIVQKKDAFKKRCFKEDYDENIGTRENHPRREKV